MLMPNRRKKAQTCWIFGAAQEWRLASPPIAISCFTFVTYVTFVTFVTNVTYDSLHPLHPLSDFHSLHPRSKFHSFHSLSNFRSFHPRLKTKWKKFWLRKTATWTVFRSQNQNAGEKGGLLSNMKIISCVRFELDFRGQIFTRRRSIDVAMWLMREEIWTEKIFKDDAGYFLRIT